MRTIAALLLCIGGLFCLCGCEAMLIGGAAAGGAAVIADTMRLERDVSFDEAWDATLSTLQDMNISVLSQDKTEGLIKAQQDDYEISIIVQEFKNRPVAIDVTVRKKGFPNLKLAEDIVENINKKFRKKIAPPVNPVVMAPLSEEEPAMEPPAMPQEDDMIPEEELK